MSITNVKRKLEKSRDAIIKVNRKKDSEFNPYEILAIVIEGDEQLGDALPPSPYLARMQVETADVIFRSLSSDSPLLDTLAEMTRSFLEFVPTNQKQRLRSAAQDAALLTLSASVISAACLACFDLFQSRERINIASRTVKRKTRAQKAVVRARLSNASTLKLFGPSEEARSDRVRVRKILAKSRSMRLDRFPEPQPLPPVPLIASAAIPSAVSTEPHHTEVPSDIQKPKEAKRATQMNSNGGPVLPNPIF